MEGLDEIEGMRRSDAEPLMAEVLRYEQACGIAADESATLSVAAADGREAAERLVALGRSRADWNRFVREVEDCLARRIGEFATLRVRSDTPAALRAVGLSDLPMNHTQRHVRNELHPEDGGRTSGGTHHGVPREALLRLPELLEHPWAVWDAKPGRDGICVALSECDAKGAPLFAFVSCNAVCYDDGRPNNFVKSVYGRLSAGAELAEAAEVGRLLYVDRAELSRFIESGRIQVKAKEKLESSPYAQCMQASPSDNILHRSCKLVNGIREDLDPYREAQQAFEAAHEQEHMPGTQAAFDVQVGLWLQGRLPRSEPLRISHTPSAALKSIGMPSMPIYHSKSQLARETGEISADIREKTPVSTLQRLPELLSRPIAVWDARPGSRDLYAALPAAGEAGGVLLARFLPNGIDKGTGRRGNILRSCLPTHRLDELVDEAAATGRLLYADAAAARELPLASRPILPAVAGGPLIHETRKARFTPVESDPYLAVQQAFDEKRRAAREARGAVVGAGGIERAKAAVGAKRPGQGLEGPSEKIDQRR